MLSLTMALHLIKVVSTAVKTNLSLQMKERASLSCRMLQSLRLLNEDPDLISRMLAQKTRTEEHAN